MNLSLTFLRLVPDDVSMEIAETCSTFRYLNKVLSKNGCDGMFYLCIYSHDVSA
jgi:hypothetical protein